MAKKNTKKTTQIEKAPVVTIMGHVDHGKTTLLDYIRKSRIAAKEAGGITQHIGAYQIDHNGKPITFIDTPGHAAFSKMRAHGASITDIIVLVVAADDGVKPQTKESVKLIKEAGVPAIVAVNKMDLKTAVPEMPKAQLVEEGLSVEGYGGDVPVVEISAIEGTNIDKLLETILVLAEVEELKADPEAPLEAVVLESALKRNQGATATLLVTNGTITVGDELASIDEAHPVSGKVKRLMEASGETLEAAGPSKAIEVLGLNEVPAVGSILSHPDTVNDIKDTVSERRQDLQAAAAAKVAQSKTEKSDDEEEQPEIKIVLLADTQGSLEAIAQNISDEVTVVHAATGEVSESDVLMAHNTDSLIIAFNVKINNSAKRLAEIEGVRMKRYTVIYKLLEEFESKILKMLEPTIDEEEIGKAKIKQVFDIRGDIIAGCVITTGAVSVGDKVHLMRDEKIVADAKVSNMKQGKVDVQKVEKDTECGIILNPPLKIQEGDYLQAFVKIDQ